MDFIKKQEEKLKEIIKNSGYDIEIVKLVPSSRPDLGQYQFNGVMELAKINKMNPRIIADAIVEKMKEKEDYADVNVAGPGFINITFSDEVLSTYIDEIREDVNVNIEKQNKKKIVIDYGGPNVAKALHVGHLRAANIGEALKRLAREVDYEVIGDIHLGDWGRPLGLVILELKKRHPDWVYFDENYDGEYPENCPIENKDLEEIYPLASTKAKENEEYLEEARIITTKLQQKEKGYYDLWKQIVKISSDEIKRTYDKLNVSFDLWYGESDADQYVEPVINYLKEKGLAYESQGALVIDVSMPGDTTEIPPLLLVKSNGAVSYETTDLATIWQRMKDFNPDEIWYVVDKRQELHFEQVFRAAYKSGIVPENVKLEFIGFGTMNGKDGKPFKTRDGGVMRLAELMETVREETLKKFNPNITGEERDCISEIVSVGALKYADLLPNRSTDYIFDIEKFSDFNGKTGVYILYSTVRMRSLLSRAFEAGEEIGPVTKFANESDRNVALKLLEMPASLNEALYDKSLSEIAEYLYQIINTYNNFYNANKVLGEEDIELKKSWLGLTQSTYNAVKVMLNVLGIIEPEKM